MVPHRRLQTTTLLRIATLTVCAWIAVDVLLGRLAMLQATGPGLPLARLAAVGLLLTAFAVILWQLLGRPAGVRPRVGVLVRLALQTAIAIVVSTDLFLVLALELPLVLPERVARWWFLSQAFLFIGIGVSIAMWGHAEFSSEFQRLPVGWKLGLTLGEVLAWQALAYAAGLVAGTEIRAHQEVRRVMAELRATSGLLAQSSRIAERLHIARELHDTLGHRLAALGVHLELAERQAEGAPAEALREARVATRQLLGEVRDVVGELRHERAFDLKRALARLLADAPGLEVEFTLSPDLDVRDPTAAHALFRCAQETLTNTIRHAGASRMWMDLRQDADGIRLKTRDDGCGAPGLREGNGLRGMRERIESLGGRLELASPRGGGLELAVWLPTPGGRR